MATHYIQLTNLADLKPGDIVKHHASDETMMVMANYGTRVTAVRTADITNTLEWSVLREKPYDFNHMPVIRKKDDGEY